ncbi:class I SAM-dependent methyltransferase [Pelagimonas varians]|uniref:dTDP-3-amino-3,4, 6-trideoxy-alpha-D-glucopyranose n=1 Tax=Pelagimonas varians TaxID=696760 RepID=A0A238KUG0_9RHOB|nr:class I SAM-dependent methyltransferase [Pelagimonas varians]PYG28269.1 methyltransferase family protein [Pelagimonas varians]SMX46357.1 dTDP-3-amino-3,4, 6-trideoxy-alpha-D-glucopyranose [Pelagimonas varians]
MATDRERDRLDALSRETHAVYQRQAEVYDRGRNRTLFERNWLERVTQDVSEGGRVLDLGCGAGAPIGEWLVAQGFEVTGADFSDRMLSLFSGRLPQARAVQADMRQLKLNQRFEAIIGWGSFFHLKPDEQRLAVPAIARHLAPGGRLLLTVGPDEGEVTGRVGSDTIYSASLALVEYTTLLQAGGAEVEDFVPNDPNCNGFSLLLARSQ